jgi:hypothetical protein
MLFGERGDGLEPDLLVRVVAMGHDRDDVLSPPDENIEALIAHVVIGKDEYGRPVTHLGPRRRHG